MARSSRVTLALLVVLSLASCSRLDPDSTEESGRHESAANEIGAAITSTLASDVTAEVTYANTLISPGEAIVTVRFPREVDREEAITVGDLASCSIFEGDLDPLSSLDVYVYGAFPNSTGSTSDRLVVDRSYTNTFATDLFGSALDLDDLDEQC